VRHVAEPVYGAQTWYVGRGWAAPAGRITLVGRDAELEGLAAAVAAMRAGQGKIVLISGEPGIGKTTLLTALVDLAAAAGARIASGAAEELEMRVPFAAVSDCLGLTGVSADRQVTEIAGLMRGAGRPAGGTFPAADAEFVVTEAILGLVDGWCAAAPVVLAVDDLQWADPASVLALHRLGRVAGQLPLLLAAARRSGTGGTDLEPLVRSWEARGADVLTLGPLDEASVVTLTGQVIGAQVGAGLRGAITAAGGNPLYVIELARTLTGNSGQAPDRAEGTRPGAQAGTRAMPESLIAMVTRRLAGLSSQTRQILQLAAVLGPTFTVAELAAVLGTPALEFLGVIQEAAAAGVLAAESDRLAFRHEVIRQALYESLPASARNALHLQAGQALAAAGAPVERAAQHLLAGTTFDVRTLEWLVRSASRLTARAPELAADLLSRVCDTAEAPGDQAGPLRLALANALLRAGRFTAAEAAAAQALTAGPDRGSRGQLRWILVQSYLNQGRVQAALDLAQRALDDCDLSQAERARFHGLAAQCLHLVSTSGPGSAMQEAAAARDASLASGDAYAMAYGLQAFAGAWRWQGRFDQALGPAGEAVAATERAGLIADSQLDPHLIRANCLFDLDRDAEARQAYAADLRLAERGLGTFFLCFHHLSVARMLFLTGWWDDALAEIASAREAPDHLRLTVHLDGLAALIAAHRQDRSQLGRLRTLLDRPLATGPARHTYDDRSWGQALATLADGDTPAAFGLLSGAWEQCAAGGREYCGHHLLPDLAMLAVPLGKQEAARRALAQLRHYCADRQGPALHRSADFAAAILDNDAAQLLTVADAYMAAGRPLLEGQAREQAAEALAAVGRGHEARLQLDAAQDRYTRLNASWDAARADARLRVLGIRRGVHGSRRRPKAGWAALTDTERTVAELLAEGMSNPDIAGRMFISRRTVQFHVSNILAKLGLSSRVELAALVARRAGQPAS
jgi:DNA-binding CsgD family transcriptional regulator/tetratricopeptide (TPR) repeat protein